MRRIIYISTVLIATVVALVACSKEDKNNEQTQATHSLNFVASQLETKTVMEIRDGKAYFDWEETDKDNIHIYESGVEATKVLANIDATTKVMSFSAEFSGSAAPIGATYTAHLNSDIRTQAPKATSYDGKCDVLSSKDINVTDRIAEISVVFEREVAVNKMTLKGLAAGESVSSVTLTSDKAISGVYKVNAWTEPSTTLTINPSGVVSNGAGEAVIYFTCLPVNDAQFTIDVETATKSYSKTFAKTISFEKGNVKLFGVTVVENSSTGTDYEYVDLGLSVKWATVNVGAKSPEEYGDYFAWGATEPWYEPGYAQENTQLLWKSNKEDGYTWINTPYQTGANPRYDNWTKWTKYLGNADSSYRGPNTTDADAKKTVLDPDDDAVSVIWGSPWRMPTYEEMNELLSSSNCTWTRTEYNGVKGFKIQSKKDGYTDKWIFLPAAGYLGSTSLYDVGSEGRYWTSTLGVNFVPYRAYSLGYGYNSTQYPDNSERNRRLGLSIRPVCQ